MQIRATDEDLAHAHFNLFMNGGGGTDLHFETVVMLVISKRGGEKKRFSCKKEKDKGL